MPNKSTPRNELYGTDDQSGRIVYPEPAGIAQHVPLVMLNTPKGDYKRHKVNGGELMEMFGADVFGANNKYTSHATVFAKMLLSHGGGKCVVQRLKPKVNVGRPEERDANVAGITYYLATTQEDNNDKRYQRKPDGTIITDANGVRQVTAELVTTKRLAVVTKYNSDVTNVKTEVLSPDGLPELTLTPLCTIRAEGHGEAYNDYGTAIYPLIGESTSKYERDTHKGILYNFRLFNKGTGRKKVVKTTFGGTDVTFSLRKYASTKLGATLSLSEQVPKIYGNYVDPLIPLQPLTLDKVIMHNSYPIEDVLGYLLTLEITSSDETKPVQQWEDFSNNKNADIVATVEKERHLVNWSSLKTTKGIPYEAIRPLNTVLYATAFSEAKVSVAISSPTIPSYLSGGEDGEVDNLDHYEANVVTEMARYMDASDIVQSLALNKETILYDSGFKFDNKIALMKIIGKRRDTNLILAPFTFNKANKPLTIAEEYTLASSLKNIAKLYPESDRFGTPTSRCAIVMHSGFVSDGTYQYRMPDTLDLGVKLAKFAGASNGAFKGTEEFSIQPKNHVSELIDIEPYYIPDTIKDKLRSAGLIYLENEDELTFFYPSVQTIYDDDTSVLNDLIENIAIGTVVRLTQQAWRQFTGVKTMSNLDVKIAVEKFVKEAIADKFNNQIIVTPTVSFTPVDKAQGYSWTLTVTVAAYNAKTVQKTHIIALRREN